MKKRILGLDQNTTKEIILKIGGHVGTWQLNAATAMKNEIVLTNHRCKSIALHNP